MPEKLVTVEPVQVNSARVILVCTLCWALALVVLACSWGWLTEHGHRSWLWTALTGTLLGVVGLLLTSRHRRLGRTR